MRRVNDRTNRTSDKALVKRVRYLDTTYGQCISEKGQRTLYGNKSSVRKYVYSFVSVEFKKG